MYDHLGTFPREKAGALYAELERQKQARRDYIYPASKLAMADNGQIVFAASDTFKVGETVYTEWADAEKAADAQRLPVEPLGRAGRLPLSRTAESQLAGRLGIPLKYIQALRSKGHADIASYNFSSLLERDERRFLVRTLDGRVRAILSDRYRILDNADLFFCAAETFQQAGADLWKARLWEDGFELFAVAPHIRGQVRLDRTFDPGDGWQSRWAGQEGDPHNAAVRIRNSETGEGGLSVSPAVMRKVCANFNVWGNSLSTVHVGRRMSEDGLLRHLGAEENTDGLFGDDTRETEGKLIWLRVRDVIRTAFDPERFKEYIDRLNAATQQAIPSAKVTQAVGNVVSAYQISEERKALILGNLLGTGDRSRYGLAQAITEAAHVIDEEGDPAEASRFESIGSDLLAMNDVHFLSLVG